MKIVRLAIELPGTLLWFSLATVQPVVAVVVFMVVLAQRDRQQRPRAIRPP